MDIVQQVSVASSSPLFTLQTPPYSSIIQNGQLSLKTLVCARSASFDLLSPECFAILYYAAQNTMRISEILALTPAQYIGHNRFIVQALKGSAQYTAIIPVLISDPEWRHSPDVAKPFISTTYDSVYRQCRRAGIGFVPTGHRNMAVTHAHRYTAARTVVAISGLRSASAALHHKSNRSVSYYLNNVGVSHGSNA